MRTPTVSENQKTESGACNEEDFELKMGTGGFRAMIGASQAMGRINSSAARAIWRLQCMSCCDMLGHRLMICDFVYFSITYDCSGLNPV